MGMDLNCIYDSRVQLGLLIVTATTILVYRFLTKSTKYRLPPGPKPWPLVGNLPILGVNNLHMVFHEMTKMYGDIFTVYMGPRLTVVLNSAKITREAFVEKANHFAGRAEAYSFNFFTDGGKDILMGQLGPVWQLQRKIAHSAVRKYASGQHLEELINLAFSHTTKHMSQETGGFDPMKYNYLIVFNILAHMCFGKVIVDDPFLTEMKRIVTDVPELIGDGFAADYMPFLRHKIFETKGLKRAKAAGDFVVKYMSKQFDDHLDTYDPECRTDLTYEVIHFWKEAQKEENNKSVLSDLDKSYLVQIISDVFFGATDSTRSTLTNLIGLLVNHPECQQKVHDELDSVIGLDGEIDLSSVEKLLYTRAALYESMRLQTIHPLAVPHATNCDTSIGEYTLPKGTIVLMNTWAIHHNPEYFPDPWTYKPDRWLDEAGHFKYNPLHFVSFSMGRRVCLGESLSKAGLPLIVAKMFQKFKFESATGEKVDLKGKYFFFLLQPDPFEVKVQERF